MGFDYGLKYIGVAYGQSLTQHATSLESLKVKDGSPDWLLVKNLVTAWQPNILVVGLPLTMENETQLLSHCAKKFAKRLGQRIALPIEFCLEQLTSWEAKQLHPQKKNETNQKYYLRLNAYAAKIIVEDWLNNKIS